VVITTCSDRDLHRSRIEGRQRGIPDWYELDWPHVERVMTSWEPLEGADLVLDASDPLAANIALLTTSLENARKVRRQPPVVIKRSLPLHQSPRTPLGASMWPRATRAAGPVALDRSPRRTNR
jgi:hypothetical protein